MYHIKSLYWKQECNSATLCNLAPRNPPVASESSSSRPTDGEMDRPTQSPCFGWASAT